MENVLDNIDTLDDIVEMYTNNANPRDLAILRTELGTEANIQRGGVIPVILGDLFKQILDILWGVVLFIKDLMKQLFHLKPWKKDAEGNHFQGYFWLYIWFSMKCGLYLVMFAIGGPIFLMMGIFLIYSKLFKKINTGNSSTIG